MSFMDKVSEMLHPGLFKSLALGSVNQYGGISGLLSRFKEKGMGDVAQNWTQGKDLDKLTPDQVDNVFGSESIQKLASQAGIEPKTASEHISKFLPSVVQHFTSSGKIPEGPITEDQLKAGVLDRVKEVFKKSA
jgi:uncharacterized protein YidB (DUF937 family)